MIERFYNSTLLYLLIGSVSLVIVTLLFYTIFSSLIGSTLKILLAFSSMLLTTSMAIYLFIKPIDAKSHESKFSKILTPVLFLPFILYVLTLIIELQSNGARSSLSFTLMALGICLAYFNVMLNDGKFGISVAMAFAFVVMFLASTYAFFPPSLGNDTWRDIIYSVEIQQGGRFPSQVNEAYPIPLVSLTYSICSLVTSVDVRWTTAFIGLEYLLAVLLSTLLIARRLIKSKNATSGNALNQIFLLTSFLVILNPLIVTWSLEFIPQAYAVTLMLSILLLISVQKNSASAYIATLPLSFAMVLSHGGVTLWFIAFLSVWLLISLFSRKLEDAITRLIGKVLKTVTVVTLAYWIYTTVIEVIVWGSRDIWSLLIGLISGGAVSRSAGAIVPVPWYTVALGYFAFCVSCVFAFVGWSFCKEAAYLRRDVVNAIFLIGTMSVAVALIGNVFNPSLSLERYLGPSAFTILAILASVGLFAMYMRGIVGRAFVSLVVVTMVCSLVFGGFYTPDYAPLGQPAWLSQKAPPTYDEVKCLEHLSSTIKTNSILIDWRAGAVFEYYCIEKLLSEGNGILEFKKRGVKISTGEVGIEVILIGSYGLTVGEKDVINYLNHENAIFVYRKGAFEKLGLLVGVDEGYLLSAVDVKEKVYDSGRIYVFAGN